MHARTIFASIVLVIGAAACGSTVESVPGGGGAGGAGAGGSGHLFACGDDLCDSATEYCMHYAIQSDPACAPMDHSVCEPFPSTCGTTPSCACLPSTMCYDEPGCADGADGEVFACDQQVC